MVLAFYPYVYLLARNAFLTQGKRSLEAAQSLGFDRTQGFFKLSLPMARPWIAGGVMLALMETLADFGTVAVFNYDTFTTAIYKAWFGMFSLSAASQLASVLIVIVFVVIIVEQRMRSGMRYAETRQSARIDRIPLSGWRAWSIAPCASVTLFFAFVLPVMSTGHLGGKCFCSVISISATSNFSGTRCCFPLWRPCSPVVSHYSWFMPTRRHPDPDYGRRGSHFHHRLRLAWRGAGSWNFHSRRMAG